ncbi:hypothetical protein HPB48_002100 [Haemaphysalis longicornis]|uniref:C2H2-type domain-containing protein n=1 Tax=Haemaphysalis longicornis TaxID=44386 RepID=A0A9J6FGB3_HAELO|nr:hypothetical protein HPB48_002100 [Haemaphysalis longicornis]
MSRSLRLVFATPRQLGSPVKRARTEPLPFRPAMGSAKGVAKKKLHTYAEPDILICGNCREVFPGLQKLLDHKRHRCRLRFTCRCHVVGLFPADSPPGERDPLNWLPTTARGRNTASFCRHAFY